MHSSRIPFNTQWTHLLGETLTFPTKFLHVDRFGKIIPGVSFCATHRHISYLFTSLNYLSSPCRSRHLAICSKQSSVFRSRKVRQIAAENKHKWFMHLFPYFSGIQWKSRAEMNVYRWKRSSFVEFSAKWVARIKLVLGQYSFVILLKTLTNEFQFEQIEEYLK